MLTFQQYLHSGQGQGIQQSLDRSVNTALSSQLRPYFGGPFPQTFENVVSGAPRQSIDPKKSSLWRGLSWTVQNDKKNVVLLVILTFTFKLLSSSESQKNDVNILKTRFEQQKYNNKFIYIYTNTNTNTKTMTMAMTIAFREPLQRANLKTCNIWDFFSDWWEYMT